MSKTSVRKKELETRRVTATTKTASKQKQTRRKPVVIKPEGEYKVLKCFQLLPDPNQPRKKFTNESLSELGESIKSQGLQQPVNVTFAYHKDGVDYYYIKHGERRWRSHKFVGLPTIKCIILNEVYDGKLSVIRLLEQSVENSNREAQSHCENIFVVKTVIDDALSKAISGKTHGVIQIAQTKVAEAHGKKISWAINYYILSKLHSKLQEMLDHDGDEKLNFSVALSLARAPHEKQQELLERAAPHFKKNFHVGLSFIAREARALREESGEKMRGRQSEHKSNFQNFADKFFKLSTQFQGPVNSHKEWIEYINKMISSMTVIEAEMMSKILFQAMIPFNEVRDLLEKKRAEHLKNLSCKR